jgi:hypothetical protein
MINLGSLHANKYAETLMQIASEPFSRTTDLNVRFVCCLVTPARKRYYGPVQKLEVFAVSMEVMWKQATIH